MTFRTGFHIKHYQLSLLDEVAGYETKHSMQLFLLGSLYIHTYEATICTLQHKLSIHMKLLYVPYSMQLTHTFVVSLWAKA